MKGTITYRFYRTLITGFIMALLAMPCKAQRISFGLFGDGLVLTPVGMATLDFNEKQTVITTGSNQIINIDLIDDTGLLAVIEVEGEKNLDVEVIISAPTVLELDSDPSETIPFNLKWAYSNTAAPSIEIAKQEAVELPSGIVSAIFPVVRRTENAPAPPPIPGHDEYTPPKAKSYLFIYGSLGPVGVVDAGFYSGLVNINVQYVDYEN